MGNVLTDPYWLLFENVRFAEDPPADDEDENEDDEDEDDEDDDEEEDDDKAKAKKAKAAEDTAGLRSALQKERNDRKKADRELKALRKFKEEEEAKNKSDTDKAKDAAEKATRKAEKLAEGYKTNSINLAVIKAANGKLAFADIDDALRLIDRESLEVEQDEDDPSDVTIDGDSVTKALKALLKKKPHLAAKASDDDDEDDEEEEDKPSRRSTGSKVGSRGTRDKGKLSEEKLKELYPQLR